MTGKKVTVMKLPVGLPRDLEDVSLKYRRKELVWNKRDGNYPFETIKTTCPFCNKEIAAIVHYEITQGEFADTKTLFWIAECPVCMQPIICDIESNCTYPPGLPFDSVKNLPEDVQKIYTECRTACGSGCYTAAVILARTLLNHVAVDKGAEENKSFQFYVNYLIDNYMPKNAKGWVDAIRALANDSTHRLEILEQQDAEQVIKFVMYLLKYIYELPAELV